MPPSLTSFERIPFSPARSDNRTRPTHRDRGRIPRGVRFPHHDRREERRSLAAARLGNSPQMVHATYSHLWIDDDDRTRQALDAVFAATTTGTDATNVN